jgi:hypothetical protein
MDKKVYEIFIDNEKYEWHEDVITGLQVRELGHIPEGVQIYLEVPGKPDEEIKNETKVNLNDHHGPARFSTQSSGSQAG